MFYQYSNSFEGFECLFVSFLLQELEANPFYPSQGEYLLIFREFMTICYGSKKLTRFLLNFSIIISEIL